MTIAFPKPDEAVLARRKEIIAGLARLVAPEALIVTEDERRAFETDGLTAYRRMPLAVVLPSTTEEVAAVLRFCHENGVKVVPRGAGTSLCRRRDPAGGRGRPRRRQDEPRARDRLRQPRRPRRGRRHQSRHQPGGARTRASSMRPTRRASSPARSPATSRMNSGGAHCLKYGVTTNNLLGVTMVLIDGTVVEIGGEHLDSAGYDLLGLITGSEGQLGVVTEATVRILRAAEGARPVLFGFDEREDAGACVAAIIGAGIIPGRASSSWTSPAIEICEAFAQAGYPLDVEAHADRRGRGLGRGDRRHARAASSPSPSRSRPSRPEGLAVGGRERARSGRAASRPSARRAASPTTSAWTARSRPASCPMSSGASTRS